MTVQAGKRKLRLEGIGKTVPPAILKECAGGKILFRYLVREGEYPGFDGRWREVGEAEQREHLRMGGQIAEWLRAIKSTEF